MKKVTKKEEVKEDSSEAHKDRQEVVVGRDVRPLEGQRVVFMASALKNDPELEADSGGGAGTITWVDPEDMDGDWKPNPPHPKPSAFDSGGEELGKVETKPKKSAEETMCSK